MAKNEGSTTIPELSANTVHKWLCGLYRLSSAELSSVRNRIDELAGHIEALTVVASGEEFANWNEDLQAAYRHCIADRAQELKALVDAATDIVFDERECAAAMGASHE